MCALPSILVGPRTHKDRKKGREDSYDSATAELKIDLSGTILASGTGLQLVRQSTPANSSTLYPNVEDYEGRHHLRPTSNKPWDIRQMKDNP